MSSSSTTMVEELSNIYQTPEWSSLYEAMVKDSSVQPIAKDWLLDQGVEDTISQEVFLNRKISNYDIWEFLKDHENNRRGWGNGRGRGNGSGNGRGSGIGWGQGDSKFKVTHMRIGKSYIVHAGDMHTFVGRVVDQIGPSTYELEKSSKIVETNNGDCWHELAAGDMNKRKKATYAHNKTMIVLPLAIGAIEWIGELPQEWEK